MAVLTTEKRDEVWGELMEFWSDNKITSSLVKLDLRAAIFSVDDEIDAAVQTFVINDEVTTTQPELWFPAASRTGPDGLTSSQKTQVISRVIDKRLFVELGV